MVASILMDTVFLMPVAVLYAFHIYSSNEAEDLGMPEHDIRVPVFAW